jgi:hypothetical protein
MMRTLSRTALCLFLAAAHAHPDGLSVDLIGDGALFLGGVSLAATVDGFSVTIKL